MARTKTADRDMTQGGIFRALLLFSLPLLAGNFFQQCYNTVDSIVLGNFVGKAALAAVGTTTPIINTLIGLFLGLSAGIGVVISQFYGAKEEEKVGQAVQTSLLLVLLPEPVLPVSVPVRMLEEPELPVLLHHYDPEICKLLIFLLQLRISFH